jgi:AraC-like DNA-binding protein
MITMISSYTVCAAVLKNRIDSLLQLGANKKDILDIIDLEFDLMNNPEEMIPLHKLVDLENAASELTNSDHIAFRIVDECKTTADAKTGILGQVAASSNTIGEAFQVAARYARLMSNAVQISIETNKNISRFSYLRNPFRFNTIVDNEIAIIDSYDILSKFGKILTIGFCHDQPKYLDRYNARFKSKIKFQQLENFIDFDSSIFRAPNPSSQPYVNKIITTYADQLLKKSAQSKNLIEDVSNLIISNLASGRVSIDFISNKLNMSRQTLYRRLKELETSFTEIFNQIQKDLSHKYQHSGNYTQLEIAFLLGFADSSSYNRARKKWTLND